MPKKSSTPSFKIGLLGESPNDTKAIEALLKTKLTSNIKFITLVDNITGNLLDNPKTINRLLRQEYESHRPNIVIVIRDLDALEDNWGKVRERRNYFNKINKIVENKAIYLLNIYTIEALIMYQIELFNNYYKCNCTIEEEPMKIIKPINMLISATNESKKKYNEGHCKDLLSKINYDRLAEDCRYFKIFNKELISRLPVINRPS